MSLQFVQWLCRNRLVRAIALAGILLGAAGSAQAAVCRAAPSGSGDGSTWASAASLHTALADVACTEIWLQQGVFRPSNSDSSISFAINRPVQIYGGFAGNETDLAQRSTNNRLTVLSGDMAGDDDNRSAEGATPAATDIQGTNSQHVVIIGGADQSQGNGFYTSAPGVGTYTRLDGLTITGGAAVQPGFAGYGGGLLCNARWYRDCSPALHNMLWSGNSAVHGGGLGHYCNGGTCSPLISDSTFTGNAASSMGGAIHMGDDESTNQTTITRSTFSGNSATEGGAISYRNNLHPLNWSIYQSTFIGNTASYRGGAIYHESRWSGHSELTIAHTTFIGNSAVSAGGAIFYYNYFAFPFTTVESSIFWGNAAPDGPHTYYTDLHSSSPEDRGNMRHSIIQGSGGSGVAWDISLGKDGGNNLDADPLLGPLADNGGYTPTLLPTALSPAIDQGAPAICNGTDQRGIARPQGAACDIGAVERASHLLTVAVTGLGAVNSSPAAIANCMASSGTCAAGFHHDSVTLTATPDADHRLASWGGACAGNTNTCVVSMSAAQSVTATFVRSSDTYTTPGGNVGLEFVGGSCVLASIHQTTAPLALPPGFSFPYGQMGFQATGCPVGGTLNVRLTFPSNVPAGAKLMKYTGSAWVEWVSTPAGAGALEFSVSDATAPGNEAATGDLNPNPGVIDDPVVLAVPLALPAGVASIPTLSEWGVLMLSALMGLAMFGVARSRASNEAIRRK